jgi:hypothetical protein
MKGIASNGFLKENKLPKSVTIMDWKNQHSSGFKSIA